MEQYVTWTLRVEGDTHIKTILLWLIYQHNMGGMGWDRRQIKYYFDISFTVREDENGIRFRSIKYLYYIGCGYTVIHIGFYEKPNFIFIMRRINS